MGQFDLIDITVGGEATKARPVEWAGDVPIKFHTTCMKCSQLIEFDGHDFVCAACGIPGTVIQQSAPVAEGGLKIALPDLKGAGLEEQKIVTEPILDPIAEKLFSTEPLDMEHYLSE